MTPEDRGGKTHLHRPMFRALVEVASIQTVEQNLRAALPPILSALQATAGAIVWIDPAGQVHRASDLAEESREVVAEWGILLETNGDSPPLKEWTVHPISDSSVLLGFPLTTAHRAAGFVAVQLPRQHEVLSLQADVTAWAGALAAILEGSAKLSAAYKRIQQMDTLYDVVRALSSTLELHDLLQETMTVAADITGAEASTLMLLDPGTDELVFEITHGSTEEELWQYRMPKDRGIAGWALTHNEPVIANDPDDDARFNSSVDQKTGFRTRSILCVPMQIKGRPIGVLEVLNKKDGSGFNTDDVRLLHTLAGQAAIAIENARLYRSLREERDRIIKVQEEVRRELARDLHDGTVQLLAAVTMNIEHVKRLLKYSPERVPDELESMAELVRTATRQTRTLLFELRPIILETRGLVAGLKSYVERLHEAGTGPEVDLVIAPDLPPLDPRIEKTVFAIIQEAVTNSRKHARSTSISIQLSCVDGTLQVTVEDDGTGFDLAAVERGYAERDSLGLVNMKERAELLDGQLEIDTAPGKGTRVTLCVPLSPPEVTAFSTTGG